MSSDDQNIRIAIALPTGHAAIVEVPVENVNGAQSPNDGAMRLADWARRQPGVLEVARDGRRVLVMVS